MKPCLISAVSVCAPSKSAMKALEGKWRNKKEDFKGPSSPALLVEAGLSVCQDSPFLRRQQGPAPPDEEGRKWVGNVKAGGSWGGVERGEPPRCLEGVGLSANTQHAFLGTRNSRKAQLDLTKGAVLSK